MHPDTYDIGIIGAGCAGLSLARELVGRYGGDLRIALLDPALLQHPEKTWSFWTHEPDRYAALAEGIWHKVSFADHRGALTEPIAPYSYVSIPARRYRQHILDELFRLPSVHLRTEASRRYGPSGRNYLIQTEGAEIRCERLFSSVHPPATRPARYALQQHFLGWFVETPEPAFESDTVTLMDFRTEPGSGAEFVYVLPYSDRRALVEYTVFSPRPWPVGTYEEKLKAYLHRRSIDRYNVTASEQGSIPMTDYPFPQQTADGLHHIGLAGGLARPATGYAFRFIEQDSALIAASLQDGQVSRFSAAGRHQFYDRLLLHLIDRFPERVPGIMSALFRRNRFADILAFLDRSSAPLDEARIFWRLPWSPFLRVLYESYLRP
ncbi:lycopene cyclase family protein [Tellurirhabdus rosea]|uniref:lycopene cyclase family protein n=1 Tax=Tellurirhabdus rosea TaxID=2674997 RepID=UPI00224D27A8|nr:lycopene cyclase family protein [Tellurirhabdus rosea]